MAFDTEPKFSVRSATIQVPLGDEDGFGFSIHASGPVMVESLVPDSPGDNAGLMEGDIILEVNGHNAIMLSHVDVANIIQYAGPHNPLTITVATPNAHCIGDEEMYRIWQKVHHKFLEEKLNKEKLCEVKTMSFEEFKESLEVITTFTSSLPMRKTSRQKIIAEIELPPRERKKNVEALRMVSTMVEPGSPPESPTLDARDDSPPLMWGWSCGDVCRWLDRKGLADFSEVFRSSKVTGIDLLCSTIDKDWLNSRGLHEEDSIQLVLDAIHSLKVSSVGVKCKERSTIDQSHLLQLPDLRESTRNLPKFVYDWTGDDVGVWLKQLHTLIYTKYLANFSKHGIDGRILLRLNSDHLKRIGITDNVHLSMLYMQILKLKIMEKGNELQELDDQTTSV
ncbi:Protein aveugle [Oopsacas minuta]|uniref:Protein aveugle n=1 Tax=Oopsacas minuta TaxID=111878 RepID=A0AAV7KFS5_9METZ|nr:Protein aveugle [Oopsacas minuta]